MKKKIWMTLLVLSMTVSLMAGCGKSTEKDSAESSGSGEAAADLDKEQKELLSWLQEAAENYNKETLKGTKSEYLTIYEDGSEDKNESVQTINSDRQILQVKNSYTYGEESGEETTWYTKEGDKEYWYVERSSWDENGEETMNNYKVLMDGEGAAYGYSALTAGPSFTFENADGTEYKDYKLSNEGEEDGAVKIRLDEQIVYKDLVQEVTRESILEDNGWTEEDIALVDGLSEALDAYVKENEENRKANEDKVYDYSTCYWVTKDTHEFIKYESASEDFDLNTDAQDAFFNLSWKVDGIKEMIADGASEEEAKEAYSEDDSSTGEKGPEVKEYKNTVTYLKGDDCEPIAELPADTKEVTYDEYMDM